MKKQIAVLAIAATSLTVSAAPTVFGKINKVLTTTSQEDIYSRTSFTGVRDVDNSESRLGVKGKAKLLHMDTTYKVSLGLNSTNGTSDRIRIRQANMTMKSKFGSVTLGQAFTPLAAMAMKSDALQDTVASFKGSDQKATIENAVSGIGFEYASRNDLITYMTPSISGFTYSLSQYKNDDNTANNLKVDVQGDITADTNADATVTEHLARYQRDMGSMNMDLYVGLRSIADGNMTKDENMVYGANLGFGAFGVNFGMSATESDKNITAAEVAAGDTDKEETNRMFAGLTYKMDAKTKFAFTYQTREDKNLNSARTQDDDREYTQMAFNVKKQCSDMTSVNLTVMTYEVENTDAQKSAVAATNALTENKATQIALGMTLKF